MICIPKWFFQFVFAATAATIVSGAIAERCQFFAYFMYSIIITGWVYPPVSHWAWDESGWLAQTNHYLDFAGSGVVHLLGASCSIVGCYFMGPRIGRFSDSGEPKDVPGHSVPLAGLGGFILIFGFLAFNGGSQGSISNAGDGDTVGLAIVNTILGASTGGITVLFVNKFVFKQPWSFLMCLNGALTGMVAMCAGCNLYEPWAVLIVGTGGGLAFLCGHHLMLRGRLDDPLDAVAVHGCGGLWGITAVAFFMYSGLEPGSRGILWDGHLSAPWTVLGYNLLGGLVIIIWSAVWSILLFGGLKMARMLRVSTEDEFKGMDLIKHGEAAYPSSAWVEYQYNRQNTNKDGALPEVMNNKGHGTATVTLNGVVNDQEGGAAFNNPFEMVPAGGKLMRGLSATFLAATNNEGQSGSHPGGNGAIDNKAFEAESGSGGKLMR